MIAGSRGGLRLRTPSGLTTRPVTDRSKESLFGHLGPARLRGAAVLDLFAGSGALAIEALSRGAASAVLVERDPDALEAIAANLASTRLADVARVHRGDAFSWLDGTYRPSPPGSLAFVDPPFATSTARVAALLERLAGPGWLSPGATVVVRRADTDGLPPLPAGWGSTWERVFGDTLVAVVTTGTTPGEGGGPGGSDRGDPDAGAPGVSRG